MCEACEIKNAMTSTEMFNWISENWETFYRMSVDNYSQTILPQAMLSKIHAEYLKYITFDQFNNAYTSTYNNLYNYAVAKTHTYMEELRSIDIAAVQTKVPDLNKKFFSDWQGAENNQVNHTTEIYEIASDAHSKGGFIMYQTSEDGKVRSAHRKANNAVSEPNSVWWKTIGYRLLGEFNCRCAAVPVMENEPDFKVKEPKIKAKDMKKYNTNFGIDEEKLMIFREDVGYFEGAPAIVRRRYKNIDLPLS